jgi:hypothetical protein
MGGGFWVPGLVWFYAGAGKGLVWSPVGGSLLLPGVV